MVCYPYALVTLPDIYFKGHWEQGFRTHLEEVEWTSIKAVETHSHFRIWWDDAGNPENTHARKMAIRSD
jgi:hypothetical protein